MNPVGKDLLTRMLPALHGDHAVYCALLHILIAAAEAECRFRMNPGGKDLLTLMLPALHGDHAV